jgi:hypothetical protein
MTRKRAANVFIFFLLVCILISCNQDAIFAILSREEPPIDPRINGLSTDLVVVADTLYVASIGSNIIHSYKDGRWGGLGSPGTIIGLAATSTHLYVLVSYDISRKNNFVYRYDGSNWADWKLVSGGFGLLQSIWGANDSLFVGARNGNIWDIYSAIGTGNLTLRIHNSGQLNGAAHDGSDYYIATSKGIYTCTDDFITITDPSVVNNSTGNVVGILNVNDVITAVTRDTFDGGRVYGRILRQDGSSSFKMISSLQNVIYTGAMCVWEKYVNGIAQGVDKSLLLLGTQNGGYGELHLDDLGQPPSTLSGISIPGGLGLLSTLIDKDTYNQTIAKHPVYHIRQIGPPVDSTLPYGQPLIFASTYKDGVWRLMNGRWNAQN